MNRFMLSLSLDDIRDLPTPVLQARLRANAPAEQTAEQYSAWDETIVILRDVLISTTYKGTAFFEYSIPRLGSRIDVVLIIGPVIFILEFKTGDGKSSLAAAVDQVTDYALDLRYFHRPSREIILAPAVVMSGVQKEPLPIRDKSDVNLFLAVVTEPSQLGTFFEQVIAITRDSEIVDPMSWVVGEYEPTPTIIEAARALYRGHNVSEITRSSAGKGTLAATSQSLLDVVRKTMHQQEKAICFVTGVPGAGKTLIGLNLATSSLSERTEQHCVYLSGNGPLVAVLREALTRDAVSQSKARGERLTKIEAGHSVKSFIQNVHQFRDDAIVGTSAPTEHIAVFDEAQRAWNLEQTRSFMARKRRRPDFNQSEPEFLISCMDRHEDWAVIVCLVGNGQEINLGEAGVAAWLDACTMHFPHWKVYASKHLSLSEESTAKPLAEICARGTFTDVPTLHLTASVRSFRSEIVSSFVNALLQFDPHAADLLDEVTKQYPILLTRDIAAAKTWVRQRARGSERYGILASSAAQRLRPYAIDVTSKIDPVHWFLNDKRDVRSCYFLETVATEFDVQGLELDWTCIAWDADFRRSARDHH
jgi:hypothetical protein